MRLRYKPQAYTGDLASNENTTRPALCLYFFTLTHLIG